MNTKLIRIQMIACSLLGLTLAGEWIYGNVARQELEDLIHKIPKADYTSEELPTLDEKQRSLDSYAEIVDRPLFNEDRKPIVVSKVTETPQTVELGQIDEWALIGIYNKDKKPTALFAKRNEAKKYLKITENQAISGWQLQEIKPDRVVLQMAGQEKIVELRKPRSQAPKPNKPGTPPRPSAKNMAPKPPEQQLIENSENINDNN